MKFFLEKISKPPNRALCKLGAARTTVLTPSKKPHACALTAQAFLFDKGMSKTLT